MLRSLSRWATLRWYLIIVGGERLVSYPGCHYFSWYDGSYIIDGKPRQVVKVSEQLEDYRTVIKWCRQQEIYDPNRIIVWGTSFAGMSVLRTVMESLFIIFCASSRRTRCKACVRRFHERIRCHWSMSIPRRDWQAALQLDLPQSRLLSSFGQVQACLRIFSGSHRCNCSRWSCRHHEHSR